MKMKCYKIRGIEKSICTAEQKIAYNFAFMWIDSGKKILNSNMAEVEKSKAFSDIEKFILRDLEEEKFNRYNHDAIMIAFRQGFENYCYNFFITADYKYIGEVFKIPYEII